MTIYGQHSKKLIQTMFYLSCYTMEMYRHTGDNYKCTLPTDITPQRIKLEKTCRTSKLMFSLYVAAEP